MDDVTRLRIGKVSIGIVGLKEALEEPADYYAGRTDEQVGDLLLKRLSIDLVSNQLDKQTSTLRVPHQHESATFIVVFKVILE